MELLHRPVNFEDERGIILDIVTHVDVQHATLLTTKANAYRGDHYHRHSGQYTFLLEGELRYVSRNRENGSVHVVTMKPCDLAFSPPSEEHGFLALQDSRILVLTYGPRGGDDFEKDTFRLPPEASLKRYL